MEDYEKLEHVIETLQQIGNGYVDLEHVEQAIEYTADIMQPLAEKDKSGV